jgi:uncharacterized small protein (DUF1192 family)
MAPLSNAADGWYSGPRRDHQNQDRGRVMDWDELNIKRAVKGVTLGESLETLSVAELEERIAALKAEIERVAAEVAHKRAHEAAAAAIFKR